ncbi:MAG TPA: ABC transporter substrate-binding protein [Reyranella sp.]|nr:ABC transporter substrate-binding protein [Reyranella sp.]
MKRRQAFAALGAAPLAFTLSVRAQAKPPLIAVLVPGTASFASQRVAAIGQGLKEAGLADGIHYRLEARFADGDFDRLPRLALELAAMKPRLFVASAAAAVAVHTTLPDMPLVFCSYALDPIAAGFAQSFVRPGGNTTGNVMNAIGGEEALTQKRIGLFKELVPGLKRLGFVGTATSTLVAVELAALRSVAAHFGLQIVHHPIETLEDIERAVAATSADDVQALYVSGETLLYNNMKRVLLPVMAAGKPTLSTYPDWARAGLLMSYSADLLDDFRRAGIYAAKILHGENPGDLPIEQASKFVLVVNARTARQLGISLPPTFLADELVD